MKYNQNTVDVFFKLNHDKSAAGNLVRRRFAFTLTRLRHRLNLTTERAARLSGLTAEQIADIEQAGTAVDFRQWINLLERYSAME